MGLNERHDFYHLKRHVVNVCLMHDSRVFSEIHGGNQCHVNLNTIMNWIKCDLFSFDMSIKIILRCGD